jgi:hypothetical protein
MTMPCRWADGLGDFAGRVRFRRRFGYPGRIDDYERVWLTFAGVGGVAEVQLNGRFLGRHEGGQEPFEFEVTSLLAARNELTVEVLAPAGNGDVWGEVALEVRSTAFLRAVQVWVTGTGEATLLHAAGEVVGTAGRPLELYLLRDHRTVAYGTAPATPAGQSFHLVSEEFRADQRHVVRVDLVNGASIWYTIERVLEVK